MTKHGVKGFRAHGTEEGAWMVGLIMAFLIIVFTGLYLWDDSRGVFNREEVEPIESTRTVMFTCTVKSNIEGVITLNDDCKITVIGEE